MSETPRFQRGEQRFLLDLYDRELGAPVLVHDPVVFLKELRQKTIEGLEVHDEMDPQDEFENPVFTAQVVLEDMADYIVRTGMEYNDERLKEYIEHERGHPRGGRALFMLLKEAGYTKEEVRNWVDNDHAELPSAERFDIKEKLAILDRVYGEGN